MIFCMLSFSPFMLGAFVKVAHSLSLTHFLRSLAVFLPHALGFSLFLSHCPSSPSAPPPFAYTHTHTHMRTYTTHTQTHTFSRACFRSRSCSRSRSLSCSRARTLFFLLSHTNTHTTSRDYRMRQNSKNQGIETLCTVLKNFSRLFRTRRHMR